MIVPDEYVGFLDREYLGGYIDGGGAAVKFVVAGDDGAADALIDGVRSAAGTRGYGTALVDAVHTRIHLLEQVWYEVARQVDWDALAAVATRAALADAGYAAPEETPIDLDRMAAAFGTDTGTLRSDAERALQARVQHDYSMVAEFRTAMFRLCQAQLGWAEGDGEAAGDRSGAVGEWLRGDLRQMSALRSALIFRRIGRHNARGMLLSLAHWLAVNGRAGLVLVLDIRRLGVTRRPDPAERLGHYYNKSMLLDAYEMLRQLVDGTDELAHCFVAVVASPSLVTDAGRGLDAYQALKLRIFDEVRDRNRDNPFASLIRLAA